MYNHIDTYPPEARNPKKSINYSKNWNGKLNCQFHTSIRIADDYWIAGDYIKVMKNNEWLFRGRIIKVQPFELKQLGEITAFLDTGKSLSETKALLKSIYPDRNLETQKLVILLIENIEFS